MSKAVLISIRPKWCQKIMTGQKTVEVRKTRPKCYIYCTKPEEKLLTIMKDGDENYGEIYRGKPVFIKTDKDSAHDMWGKRQKVVAEFVCDKIIGVDGAGRIPSDIARPTCLEPAELHQYLGAAVGYGWHISYLRVYDHPRDLWEFTGLRQTKFGLAPGPITRPPQSWRYVEEELWND